LLSKEGCNPTVESIAKGIEYWPAGERWAKRKISLFDKDAIQIALGRLRQISL